ncbi:MAG: hypothetical protein OWU84_05265 [Firmicutes bacterium]|nr:hypothetical protein [Bacillota bacterium]
MKVLISNDDGIDAEGLAVLTDWARRQSLQPLIVAPDHNASGQSSAVTLGTALKVQERGAGRWAVSGSPADCIRVALTFLGYRPDIVLVGINHGWNLGADVYVSGTVGAARYAALKGIPSVAFSAAPTDWAHVRRLMALHASQIVKDAVQAGSGFVCSVNFPTRGGQRRVRTTLSSESSRDQVAWAEFREGHHLVRLTLDAPGPAQPGSDADAIRRQWTTVTALRLEAAVAAPAVSHAVRGRV